MEVGGIITIYRTHRHQCTFINKKTIEKRSVPIAMSKKKCYTNSVHGEDCKNQARDAESQTQGRAEFARTNTLADRATAGPQPARGEVAVLEEARTKCSEISHVNDCLSFTELSDKVS